MTSHSAPHPAARRWAWTLFGLGILVRLVLVPRDLPYYGVDENELVEGAYVFLSGDLRPSFFSYGPLLSYVLAGLYAVGWGFMALAEGWSRTTFFHAAIFEPTPFYAVARGLHALADAAAVVLAAGLARRCAGVAAQWAVLSLGAAPLLSLNSAFVVRNDTLQGLLALAALGFVARENASPRASAALAGAAAGLSLAVKPLQALLVAPALGLGLLTLSKGEGRPPFLRSLGLRIDVLASFVVAAVAGHTLANPYAIIRPGAFWKDVTGWLGRQPPATSHGWSFTWWVDVAGWPLAVFAGIAIVIVPFVARDRTARLLLLYVATVLCVYLPMGTRPYWYNAILPAVLALCGLVAGRLSEKLASWKGWSAANVGIALGTLLTAVPLTLALVDAWHAWSPTPSIERRSDREAQRWIEREVPAGSHLLVVGRYAQGAPRLVAETPSVHGEWADHFMYGRWASRPWQDVFRAAYRQHRRQGAPLYWITNVRRDYTDQWDDPTTVERMHESLPALARQASARYIVTVSSSRFSGRWERRSDVRLLATFAPAFSAGRDAEVKVFQLAPMGRSDSGR